MKFRPLHDRVVVKRVDAEEKTKGGIIIPDTAKEKPQEGEVIAAGPGARDESGKLIPLDLKAGDRILFGKWSGTEIKIEGEDLLIMKESDVMGVVEAQAASRPARPPARRPDADLPISIEPKERSCLRKKSSFPARRASACCAASTFSPMRSRSRWARRGATSCSRSPMARRA
jgi:chaperonin GroES